MTKRKIPLKRDGKSQKLNALPGLERKESDSEKASRFVSALQSKGFVSKHKTYLENYVNADISIAFSHIKQAYQTYVLNGRWAEDKFETVMNAIMSSGEMLVPKAFMKYGMRYDKGKLNSFKEEQYESSHEKSIQEMSDEELIAWFSKADGDNS